MDKEIEDKVAEISQKLRNSLRSYIGAVNEKETKERIKVVLDTLVQRNFRFPDRFDTDIVQDDKDKHRFIIVPKNLYTAVALYEGESKAILLALENKIVCVTERGIYSERGGCYFFTPNYPSKVIEVVLNEDEENK